MTSREHARRLMLILLSSEGRPGAKAAEAEGNGQNDEDRERRDRQDDCSESDRRLWPAVAGCT